MSFRMTYLEFAKIWNSAACVADVAAQTGQSKAAASTLAHRMRSDGWKMKKFPYQYEKSLIDRFWSFVTKGDGCWVWSGSKNPKGYGQIQKGRRGAGMRPLLSHRVSWEIHFGSIPNGMKVLHHCDNPSCVRPDHLFLGTDADNTADMIKKERGSWQKNAPGTFKKESRELIGLKTAERVLVDL